MARGMIAPGHLAAFPPSETPAIVPRVLTQLLDRAVAEHGDWPAIDFLGRRWTYAEIGALVRRAARGLQDLGVTKGMRIGLCLPNTPYFVILYFAALRAGAVVVNFNPLYVERELKHQILDSGTTIMVVPDLAVIHAKVAAIAGECGLEKIIVCPFAEALPPAKSLLFRLFKRKDIARIPTDARHIAYAALIARDADPDPVAVVPDDLAVLQYTGGTTGVPKGAMLSHANLAANSAQMALHCGDPPAQERTLGVLPMFHVFALTTVLNYSIETAAEMVLLPRFEMKQFLKVARRTRPTQFFGVPTIYAALAQRSAKEVTALASFKLSISGGAPLPYEVRQAFEQRTGCRLVEGYGLSEASPIIACNPLWEGEVKANSCGPCFPGTVLEIRSLADPHVVLPQGERGEVCARGPQVMQGYWNKPEATDAVFVDGALRTGDVGYLDEDGYLFLVDRIKDMILCGGYNVYPRVIEDALYEHPAVAEAVVIGLPDAYRGQSPKAFVTLHPGTDADEAGLCEFLSSRISKIEMPRAIDIRDTLPKTLIGKLSKKALVDEERAKAGA